MSRAGDLAENPATTTVHRPRLIGPGVKDREADPEETKNLLLSSP